MNLEQPNIPSNPEHLEALEETIKKIEEIISQKQDLLNKHERILQDMKELGIIIRGLYSTAEKIRSKGRIFTEKTPETEEEWNDWIKEGDRLFGVYEKISNLEEEFDTLISKAEIIESEQESLDKN
jgi:flagellar motor component MotA